MQVNNFIKYLDNSTSASSISKEEINPLLAEFPYCQTGQLLQTVYLKNSNSILFEQQLKKAAAYCTDRHKLFEHLNRENSKIIVAEKEKEEELQKAEVKQKSTKTPDINKMDVLEKEYLTAAISSSILLESESEIFEKPILSEEKQHEEVTEVNLFDEEKGHTFTDWLKHYSGDEVVEDNNEAQQSKQDLIDKFIQEDPKIQPKKTEFYSPTNMARLSVVDDSDIVSETLALVYVDQGKYHEAIRAYEKLSLKNPEKSSYFASQIKILNQKIK
jgi:tetratricopeptide (TPR) repeat protein